MRAFWRSWSFIWTVLAVYVVFPWTSFYLPGTPSPLSTLTVPDTQGGNTCAALPDSILSAEDFVAKTKPNLRTCPAGHYSLVTSHTTSSVDDYSCSATKPCSNGACCAQSDYCGYGPDSCGNGQSPNDKCWSNPPPLLFQLLSPHRTILSVPSLSYPNRPIPFYTPLFPISPPPTDPPYPPANLPF